MLLVSSAQLPALSQIFWFSAQKPRLAQKQQHKQQQQQQQTKQQTIAKPFQNRPKPLRAGFWPAAILTRSERRANEVRNQILGDWPPKSPDKVFGSHTLSHSFQNSKTQELSAVEQKRKPSQAAAAGKSKETEEETKGVRETEGRQRDASLANKAAVRNLSGHRMVETSESSDSQRYLKAKTVWGREIKNKGRGRGTTRHGAAGQDDLCLCSIVYTVFEPQTEAKHNSNTFFTY